MGNALPLTFEDCVRLCRGNAELVREWERLSGQRFARNPVETMVDQATGHGAAVAAAFEMFVLEYVWMTWEGRR